MTRTNKILISFLSILISFGLNAGVNLKNGNFYVTYTDAKIASSFAAIAEISRTYNSKSTTIGLFGYGWGTIFESHLYSYPDGSIVMAEYGAGGKSVFTSPFTTDDMIDTMIDQIIEILIQEDALENSPNAIFNKREELMINQAIRRANWDKYVEKGLLEYTTNLPTGMEWESFQRGNERIIKTETGFQRSGNSKIEDFNLGGQLIKIDKKNGVWSTLEYNNGKLSKITNADGSYFTISTSQNGFITTVSQGDRNAEFKYENNNLVYAQDVSGNQYKYVYDEKHNLTKIVYNPVRLKGVAEDAMLIEYEPKTSYATKITNRNGEITEYQYHIFYKEDGTKDGDHYATSVIKEDYSGNKTTNEYEYFIGVKANGERYTQKINTTIRGIITETTYDELCNKPLEIIRGNYKTTFKYNNRCLLIEKLSDRDSIYMKYHPKLEKITYVKSNEGEFNFEYNDTGNLTYVDNQDSEWAKLVYNDNGKITQMIQEDKTLNFIYNDIGKPIKITMEGVGSINVTYDEYGEIAGVRSEDGSNMAIKVTQAFQKLLSLVKPAGVNLNM